MQVTEAKKAKYMAKAIKVVTSHIGKLDAFIFISAQKVKGGLKVGDVVIGETDMLVKASEAAIADKNSNLEEILGDAMITVLTSKLKELEKPKRGRPKKS